MRMMDAFEDYLADNRGMYMSVITPGGNHGDTLIHMGLVKKLEEHRVQYRCINLETLYKKKPILGAQYLINIGLWKLGKSQGFKLIDLPEETQLILFEGGGYMNDVWYGPVLLKQAIKNNSLPVTVAPQSYLFIHTRLHQYFEDGRQAYLFCREPYSLEHLKKKGLPSNVYTALSPELALYLTREDLKQFIEPREDGYQLLAFRHDKESALEKTTKDEVTEISDNPVVADISMEKTMADFVSMVYNAQYVYTDRLHVAILSMILGKQVTLFGNRYHKNRGVWEYSLKDHVQFVEV